MSVQDRGNGSPSGRWTPWRPMIRATLAIGLIGGGVPAFGQSTLYDQSRVLRQSPGSACGGANLCTTLEGGTQFLQAGQSKVLTFQCPKKAPYFAGWDAEHNEQIRATMEPQPPLDSGDVPSGSNIRLVILAENVGTETGRIAVFIGCSTAATLPTSMRHASSGNPSNFRAILSGGH